MASIKVKFRASTLSGHEGSLYFQIIHERRIRQIGTKYHLLPEEWDVRHSAITIGSTTRRVEHVRTVRISVSREIERLTRIINRLDRESILYTVDDIVTCYEQYMAEYTLFSFSETLISRLKSNGRPRTSETYRATISSFKRFRNGRDLHLDELSADIIEDYQAFLLGNGLTYNTVSFYMRILRAIYNKAIDRFVINDESPFRHAYTGIDKTLKRALPLRDIKKIRTLDLQQRPAIEFARDIFMLSFYFRGMSIIDMAFLRKSDLKDGYITYRRQKTGRQLYIKWTDEMQQILDKYPRHDTDYLLPIIRSRTVNPRYAYRNMAYNINRNLKKVAKMIGSNAPLTLYVARHSWASLAHNRGIALGVISEGMGHDSEMTTRIYLASLDTTAVDRANAKILNLL